MPPMETLGRLGLGARLGTWRCSHKRGWRKLHLAVDAITGDVAAAELTGRRVHDSRPVRPLLRQVKAGLVSLSADGAYDRRPVYEAAAAHAVCRGRAVPRILIPPCKPAQLVGAPTAAMAQRNRNLRSIRKRSRRRWHKASDYSWRSLVETAMSRFEPRPVAASSTG